MNTPLSILTAQKSAPQIEALLALQILKEVNFNDQHFPMVSFSQKIIKTLKFYENFLEHFDRQDQKKIATLTFLQTVSAQMFTEFDREGGV